MLKFSAGYPFEDQVVMMVCGSPDHKENLAAAGLITITGSKAGINCYVTLPEEARESGLSTSWLIDNWQMWVCPEGNINDVWVRSPLNASELT